MRTSARLERRLRRLIYDRVVVIIEGCEEDEDDEEETERDEEDAHALAQWEIARSTMVEIAPSRPPKMEELELELDEEVLDDTDSGRGVLGGEGGSRGSPLYISSKSCSSAKVTVCGGTAMEK